MEMVEFRERKAKCCICKLLNEGLKGMGDKAYNVSRFNPKHPDVKVKLQTFMVLVIACKLLCGALVMHLPTDARTKQLRLLTRVDVGRAVLSAKSLIKITIVEETDREAKMQRLMPIQHCLFQPCAAYRICVMRAGQLPRKQPWRNWPWQRAFTQVP